MSAIRMKGELQDYYTRKVGEGKNKIGPPMRLVLNAVRNNGAARAADSSGLLSGSPPAEI